MTDADGYDYTSELRFALSAETEKRAAMESRIRALHYDAGNSQGYFSLKYGEYDHCCNECGSFGEYGIAWPCATFLALEPAPQTPAQTTSAPSSASVLGDTE